MLKDLMRRRLVATEPDTTVAEAAKIMEREDIGCVVILEDDDKPRGIITDRDIVTRCIAKNIDVDDCTVENVMTESLQTVKETDDIMDCIQAMHRAGVRRIPVVDEQGRAVGLFSSGDMLSFLSNEFTTLSEATTPLGEEMRRAA